MPANAPVTILIVDDEAQNCRLFDALLRPAGYLTQIAFSGEAAIASIASQAPDLILLDIMMPGMDGFAVARLLKATSATSSIPIIMVTALADRSARLAGLKAGVEEFMTKPVDRAELWLRVRNLLRLKEHSNFLKGQAALLEQQVQARTAQLQSANQALEALSYSLSHDLRSPLTSIDGFSKLLGRAVAKTVGDPLAERSQHYLARIQAGVRQMGDLIDAFLSLAHVTHTPLRCELVDVSALACDFFNGARERAPGRATRIHVEAGMFAQGDPRLIRRVLDQLMGNAWKFSAGQALTEITFGHEIDKDGETVYVVRDNGVGFDMAYSGKLFNAFQRLHGATEFAGTGIGLATVQKIITRHGGRVWAISAPDEGAAFHFTLGRLKAQALFPSGN